MAWIESHQELGRHPKTRKLARLLCTSIPAVVGHLHFFWWWALDFAQDGSLAKFDADEIADAALWEGDSTTFYRALITAGFVDELDDDTTIHDWDEFAGRLIDKRKANAERMRQARAANDETRATHVQRTFHARAGATVPNRTVPNPTSQGDGGDNPSPSRAARPVAAADAGGKKGRGSVPAKTDPIWDALCEVTGVTPVLKAERSKRGGVVKQLKEVGATPEQVHAHAARYRVLYPNAALTDTALSKHWSECDPRLPILIPRASTGAGFRPKFTPPEPEPYLVTAADRPIKAFVPPEDRPEHP